MVSTIRISLGYKEASFTVPCPTRLMAGEANCMVLSHGRSMSSRSSCPSELDEDVNRSNVRFSRS